MEFCSRCRCLGAQGLPVPLHASWRPYRRADEVAFWQEVAVQESQVCFHLCGKFRRAAGHGRRRPFQPLLISLPASLGSSSSLCSFSVVALRFSRVLSGGPANGRGPFPFFKTVSPFRL